MNGSAPNLALVLAAAKERKSKAHQSLYEFIPYASPEYHRPSHLKRYVDLLESTLVKPTFACVSAPPRHAKSVTTLHFVVLLLLRNPKVRIAYITYAQEFSEHQARLAKQIARRVGLRLAECRANLWTTEEGGFIDWQSIGGQLTGKGYDLIVVDDPHKGRSEAESKVVRDTTHSWFLGDCFSRRNPGASVIIMATRWHPDDLSGRQIASGWDCINLPAVNDNGDALWPERYPVTELELIRTTIGDYDWSALYQGEPRSKGGRVFGEPTFGKLDPSQPCEKSIGADFAYSTKSSADYSVAVVIAKQSDRYFILDLIRRQVQAPEFAAILATIQQQNGGSVVRTYIGGTEKAMIDFMRTRGVRVVDLPASTDKFVRAQAFAAQWNAGNVLLPQNAPWTSTLVSELADFTGIKDKHDDQVDALSGAFQPWAIPAAPRLVG